MEHGAKTTLTKATAAGGLSLAARLRRDERYDGLYPRCLIERFETEETLAQSVACQPPRAASSVRQKKWPKKAEEQQAIFVFLDARLGPVNHTTKQPLSTSAACRGSGSAGVHSQDHSLLKSKTQS